MRYKDPLLLEREILDGEPYDFFSLGNYVVMAPDICGGEATFKYTRINVSVILGMLRAGYSVDELVEEYDSPYLTHDAIREAVHLADRALAHQSKERFVAAIAA